MASGELRGVGAREGHGSDYDQRAQQCRKAGNTGRVLWEPPAGMTGRSLKGHCAVDESHDLRSTSPTWGPQVMVVG